jgi:hypothetical protein
MMVGPLAAGSYAATNMGPLDQCFTTCEPRPSYGPQCSFSGLQGFFILLKLIILDTDFINIIKSQPYQLQNHEETTKIR